MLTQKNYRPTPYQDCSWEIVGERSTELSFAPLQMEVIKGAEAAPDPMFEDFDDQRPKRSRRTEEARSEPAKQVDVMSLAEVQAKLAESFEAGRLAGIEEGKAILLEEVGRHEEELGRKMLEFGRSVEAEASNLFARIEKEAIKLALAVSRKILSTTADVKPDYIVTVIREGLKSLGAAQPIKIRVSPQDYEFLEVVGLPADISSEELGVEYASDESVKAGCVIETNFGVVDLELDHMWEQIREQLYEVYR